MTTLKKGQAVKARTARNPTLHDGKVAAIAESANGPWVTVQPDDKAVKPFKTRPALCTPV